LAALSAALSAALRAYLVFSNIVPLIMEFDQSNMLLKSVLHDLQQPFLVAEVRAFGILSKTIMAPLWRVLECKDVDMAKMNGIYSSMVSFFDLAVADSTIVMHGDSPFEEEYLIRDAWWDKLFAPNEVLDGLTLTALAVILQALR
jgi:hypothetical protein